MEEDLKECQNFNLGGVVIICGCNTTNHKCNDEAVCYDTNEARFYFKNSDEADKWFDVNYKDVISCSVACSICERAVIDDAMWL